MEFCAELLEQCRGEKPEAYQQEPPMGWLEYCYWYAIGLSYPDSVQDKLAAAYQDGAQYFLMRLRERLQEKPEGEAFDPFSEFAFLSPQELPDNAITVEYERFLEHFQQEYVYELMIIGREIFYFNILSHIAGVHYVAMHVARQLQAAGVPINLALVSGAAIGHDIGKFGCKPSEVSRMAHLHYYYTDIWFQQKNMPSIAHIAVNHSTWDLELENLPLESLILIYADFRVRRKEGDYAKEQMGIFSLSEAFHIIFSKLENLDGVKKKRYAYVYAKLQDFEQYMKSLGVNTDLTTTELQPPVHKDIILADGQEVVERFKWLTVKHNIWLMDTLNTESSFGEMLEAARSEKDWKNTRAYIHIFEEYFIYMTQKQKLLTLNFFYELLMHHEGDIRRQAAVLLGKIIVNYDEKYRKELPCGVVLPLEQVNGLTLWKRYLEKIILPDHKITDQHKRWMGYALKLVVQSALADAAPQEQGAYLAELLQYYQRTDWNEETAFTLIDTLILVPVQSCTDTQLEMMLRFTQGMFDKQNIEIQAGILRFLDMCTRTVRFAEPMVQPILFILQQLDDQMPLSMRYAAGKIAFQIDRGKQPELFLLRELAEEHQVISEILLENLKVATPWILKIMNVDLLMDAASMDEHISILQIATHLSNLLKVSERVTVRHQAGNSLVAIVPWLTPEQRNELVIELTKGLEIGEYEFSKYIPEYLGQIALHLQPLELDEFVQDIHRLLNSTNTRVVAVALQTMGIVLEYYPAYAKRFPEPAAVYRNRQTHLLGAILGGLANYNEEISQEAFLVLGHTLFGSKRLTLDQKYDIFYLLYKRMLVLIYNKEMSGLAFLNRAGALNHIYRFISDYLYEYQAFDMQESEKIAFFPGTFDPFSLGHKGIAQTIRDMGYQVYLALDEFSWSKKTQPRMTRRQIITMSIADEENMFLFPDDIPINLGNDQDLARLQKLFPGKELYIVVGSDVIANASSYRKVPTATSIHQFNHIIFKRSSAMDVTLPVEINIPTGNILGKVVILELPTHLEDISSSRIRQNIDCNRDISNLISPVAQSYIYQYGLYLREPQYKPILQAQHIKMEVITVQDASLIEQLGDSFAKQERMQIMLKQHWQRPQAAAVLLRDARQQQQIAACMLLHSLETTNLFDEFADPNMVVLVRKKTFGRIAVISGVYRTAQCQVGNIDQLLLTEAMAYYLAQDYGYALYHGCMQPELEDVLRRQGFLQLGEDYGKILYVVDMREPVTLVKNMESTIKEPFNHHEAVLQVLEQSHHRLQEAMIRFYPGRLILSVDAGIMHHKMMDIITAANHVPSEPTVERRLGRNMCVPFGKILRGMVVPNTVTKTLHTEKIYSGDIQKFHIAHVPFYSPIEDQIKTIKSFQRPVILVDDLLHKGHRIRNIEPILRRENISLDRLVVGVMSARGKDLMDMQNMQVESAYFVPRLHAWYVESTLYPFIGGDMVERDHPVEDNLLPSVNFILPYVVPSYMRDISKECLYHFSMVCLENVHSILKVLEEEYQNEFERRLTLGRLSEVVISPRCPDHGEYIHYDRNIAASAYVEDDIERLARLQSIVRT